MGHAQTRDANTSRKHGTKRELTAMEFGSPRGEYCMSSRSRGVFCDATLVARVSHRRRPHAMTCSMRRSVRSRLNLQMRHRCLQQQTSQGKRDLLVLCCGGCVIDCWHLQKQECQKMNASLRTENHGEQMAPLIGFKYAADIHDDVIRPIHHRQESVLCKIPCSHKERSDCNH